MRRGWGTKQIRNTTARADALAFAALALALVFSGCPGLDPPTNLNTGAGDGIVGGSSGSSSAVSPYTAEYQSAAAVKVVFNKQSFYNNDTPNNSGCAGDAKIYYDPQTDRQVPSQPAWLNNVAVELTNSNALNGPSNATGCSLTGSGSPPAANCATFDDLQMLQGSSSRGVVMGGMGCASATSGCSSVSAAQSLLGDIWEALIPSDATQMTWAEQTPVLNVYGASAGQGATWAAGDYDELHDEFYFYGGAVSATNTTTLTYSNAVVSLNFDSTDKSVSSSLPPATPTPSTTGSFASWSLHGLNAGLDPYISPPPLVGSSFTYSPRRDPTTKTWCKDGDSNCTASTVAGEAAANNEHSDYFLLLGGLNDGVDGAGASVAPFDAANAYEVSKHFWMYKPHGLSDSSGATAPTGGDWTLLSNDSNGTLASTIMKVVEIENTGNSSLPFIPINATWNGRAYHRTVYDPTMNRFYIFGGLETSANATTTVPSLGDNDVWVYDPPALGRRPTAACFTNKTPDNVSLPVASSATMDIGTSALDINQSYLSNKFVFPPGGCLQRLEVANAPDARFEQAMALDRDQKAMVVFGGCQMPAEIPASGTTNAGDPTTNCNSSTALFNDTWLYLPPNVSEIVSQNYVETNLTPSPYSADSGSTFYRLANIFSTDFWLNYQPLYADNNLSSAALTQPTTDQVMGVWIPMDPAVSPTKRTSAMFYYDRGHKKFYLEGGFGCRDTACTDIGTMNDLWEYVPPDVANDCSRTSGTCVTSGTWTQILAQNETSTTQPTPRKGAVSAHAETMFSFADDFYTVTDTSCVNQGPLITGDTSSDKQYVGAIYIDINRSEINSARNLVINLRFLPFDDNTKLPGIFNNNTPLYTADDLDHAGTSDQALIHVQLITNPISTPSLIQSLIQPRFYEFLNSNVTYSARDLEYVAGGTGQVTEKQILIPLNGADNSDGTDFNMIKIERVQGSVKFYEMSMWLY